ncbi:MAG: hypothetical protein EZS28_017279 [Streblomastix strix]|uniref:Uncharacterized protein n=1 Tax=Streblomastix strix TaxID=222440 RepID=A0A5J4VX76_9EUKA|nr:MAG: hypothetical protein EZS28_017279 [Streblomastix strix]
MHNFGKVLYSLAELNKLPIIEQKQPIQFNFIHEKSVQSLIQSLLIEDQSQLPSSSKLLEIPEIQDRIKQSQLIPIQSAKSPDDQTKEQFVNYRKYLANLLVEIAGSSVEDRLTITQRGVFNDFVDILKWARVQNKVYSRKIQEWVCETIEQIIDKNEDAVQIATETDILNELRILLGTDLALQEVKFKEMFFNPCEHSYFDKLNDDGICTSLFEHGLKKGKTFRIQAIAAYGLGWLYKMKPLPVEMRHSVIQQLKTRIISNDTPFTQNCLNAIACLENHSEILQDNFIDEEFQILRTDINIGNKINILTLTKGLLEVGTELTQETVKQKFPTEYKLKKDVEGKDLDERIDITYSEILDDITSILKQGIGEQGENIGLIILILQYVEDLLVQGDDAVPLQLDENEFIDSLFQIYGQLEPSQITDKLTQILILVRYNRKKMNCQTNQLSMVELKGL